MIGPTADLVNPTDSGVIGQAVINGRGFIDVPFATPAGATLSTSTILGLSTPPFTLGGTDAACRSARDDTTQAPVVVSTASYVLRYWTIGTLTTNDVTVTFASGAYSYATTSGSIGSNAAATVSPVDSSYTIDGTSVDTAQIGYIDVRFTPTTGDQIDLSAITSAATAPFTLGGPGVGTAALVPFSTLAPTQISIDVVRFYVTGSYAPERSRSHSRVTVSSR